MENITDQLRIWKVSHGKDSFTAAEREDYLKRNLIVVHSETGRGQGEAFVNQMKPGDFIYLTHRNDIQLLGRIRPERSWDGRWLQRKYETIRMRQSENGHFEGRQRGWTPNYDSTCWRVPREQIREFKRVILTPFFRMKLSDLASSVPLSPVNDKKRSTIKHRLPQSMSDYREAYFQVVESAKRRVSPRHQHFQVELRRFLRRKGVAAEFEKDNIDVQFRLKRRMFIGEVKVSTPCFQPRDAFRAALGQLLDYSNLKFEHPPRMIMFLDAETDPSRLKLASSLLIAIVVKEKGIFRLANPSIAPTLREVFD